MDTSVCVQGKSPYNYLKKLYEPFSLDVYFLLLSHLFYHLQALINGKVIANGKDQRLIRGVKPRNREDPSP